VRRQENSDAVPGVTPFFPEEDWKRQSPETDNMIKTLLRSRGVSLIFLLTTSLTGVQAQNAQPQKKTTERLEARIQELEARVRELEALVHKLANAEPVQNPPQAGEQAPKTAAPATSSVRADKLKPPAVKVSGLMFGDYYYMAQNHNASVEDENGFRFRRAYLTFDGKLNDFVDTQLRFEMNSPGDFVSTGKLNPFVKDAWIRLKYASDQQAILGMSWTPAFEFIENFWGYRSLEKTALDLQQMESSRDFGIALKGGVGSSGIADYHLMVSNGAGEKSETNQGKKVLFAIGHLPSKGVVAQFFTDYEWRPEGPRYTFQGFLGYGGSRGRVGLQYAHQRRKLLPKNVDLNLLSVFGVGNVSERVSLIGRYDRMFEPNPEGNSIGYLPFDPQAKSNLFLAGLDLKAYSRFSIMPNVEVVKYDKTAGGTTPATDLVPRLTFFYTF
jgi:hypothetical protein